MSQHMNALARANEVRTARCALKRRIAAGETTVAEVLRDVPWEAKTMPLAELLMAQHRWGVDRTRKLCQRLVLSEFRRVGSLTARERGRVAGLVAFDSAEDIEWAA